MEQTEAKQNNFMVKLASFIVDKRNLFFLITVIALIFSGFSRNWVQVENELTAFLPDDAETKLALDVMEEQFTTYGTARVMAAMPMATPSPWRMVKLLQASTAWPMVCPRFSRARCPRSNSSLCTTSRFISTQAAITASNCSRTGVAFNC